MANNRENVRNPRGSLTNPSQHNPLPIVNQQAETSNDLEVPSDIPPEIICNICQQPIKGLIVQALGKTWHQEHFLCHHCRKPIVGQKFNVHDSKPYCEQDYAQLFLKRCHGCNLPIRDVVVVALNNNWHRDHFVCSTCGTKLANMGFFERENNPFCQRCYEQKFCPRCKECNLPVTNTAIMALGEKWHQNCFKCKNCGKPITESTFEVQNEKPICAKCVPLVSASNVVN